MECGDPRTGAVVKMEPQVSNMYPCSRGFMNYPFHDHQVRGNLSVFTTSVSKGVSTGAGVHCPWFPMASRPTITGMFSSDEIRNKTVFENEVSRRAKVGFTCGVKSEPVQHHHQITMNESGYSDSWTVPPGERVKTEFRPSELPCRIKAKPIHSDRRENVVETDNPDSAIVSQRGGVKTEFSPSGHTCRLNAEPFSCDQRHDLNESYTPEIAALHPSAGIKREFRPSGHTCRLQAEPIFCDQGKSLNESYTADLANLHPRTGGQTELGPASDTCRIKTEPVDCDQGESVNGSETPSLWTLHRGMPGGSVDTECRPRRSNCMITTEPVQYYQGETVNARDCMMPETVHPGRGLVPECWSLKSEPLEEGEIPREEIPGLLSRLRKNHETNVNVCDKFRQCSDVQPVVKLAKLSPDIRPVRVPKYKDTEFGEITLDGGGVTTYRSKEFAKRTMTQSGQRNQGKTAIGHVDRNKTTASDILGSGQRETIDVMESSIHHTENVLSLEPRINSGNDNTRFVSQKNSLASANLGNLSKTHAQHDQRSIAMGQVDQNKNNLPTVLGNGEREKTGVMESRIHHIENVLSLKPNINSRSKYTTSVSQKSHLASPNLENLENLKTHPTISTGHAPKLNPVQLCTSTYMQVSGKFPGIHTETQPIEKPYHCNICSEKFDKLYMLDSHIRAHRKAVGYQRYVCGTCQKSFSNSYGLKTHMYLHKAQRPFTCKQCKPSSQFADYDKFERHMEHCHRVIKRFKCPKCEKRYAFKIGQQKHLATHGDEP